jgi:hypothetical protein
MQPWGRQDKGVSAMRELTKAQKARHAIREFKTITDALAIRGFYRPRGKLGKSLEHCLRNLSPEIYGSMNDPRVVELKGLEYVIDRLPRAIEECTRIILTEEDPYKNSAFEETVPLRRRRTCYRVGKNEMCFVISRGLSEIYDIMTHITFLYGEAKKIHGRMKDDSGNKTLEWIELEKTIQNFNQLGAAEFDQALWSLSIVLGRPYQETRATYESLEKNRTEHSSNNGFFSLIYHLGKQVDEEIENKESSLVVYLTPSLMNIIGHQEYEKKWSANIHKKLIELNLQGRPLHIICANLHSVLGTLYGYGATDPGSHKELNGGDLYDFFYQIRDRHEAVKEYAGKHGFYDLPDSSGTHIGCQLIDTAGLNTVKFHPDIKINKSGIIANKPVILVADYAFGAQAFDLMSNLLKSFPEDGNSVTFNFKSISIMGKAGILSGEKGDIMLATSHVFEGTSDNYLFDNDLREKDFGNTIKVYSGPMITVLGTSLQNRDMLMKFQSDWKTVGLEMEGGHYQRAISAATIKGDISRQVKVRYAYYASDNPLKTGSTLAAGAMGQGGVKPTYMITKVILEKILGGRTRKS